MDHSPSGVKDEKIEIGRERKQGENCQDRQVPAGDVRPAFQTYRPRSFMDDRGNGENEKRYLIIMPVGLEKSGGGIEVEINADCGEDQE
jgi:hypothetical protein